MFLTLIKSPMSTGPVYGLLSVFVFGVPAWLVVGVSASQLASDIAIMENRIRLKKPYLLKNDGPYNRTSAWSSLDTCVYKRARVYAV